MPDDEAALLDAVRVAQQNDTSDQALTTDPEELALLQAVQAAHATEAPQQGGILDTAGSVLSDIGTGIAEAPRAIAKGVTSAVNNVSDAAFSAAQYMESKVPLGSIHFGGPDGIVSYHPDTMPEGNSLKVWDTLADPTSTTGNLVKDVSRFLTGFVGGMRLVTGVRAAGEAAVLGNTALSTLGTAGKFATAAGAGALSDAFAADPYEDRLSNLRESYPLLDNTVTRYLSAKPEDGEAEGRFKNALEGLMLGTAAEGVFLMAKAVKALRAGDTATAEAVAREAEQVAPKLELEATQLELPLDGGGPRADSIHEQVRPKVDTDAGTAGPTDATKEGIATTPKATAKPPVFMDDTAVSRFRERLGYLEENMGPNSRPGFEPDDFMEGIDFNFNALDSEDKVKAAVNSMSSVIQEQTLKVKGGNAEGVRSLANVRRNAERLADITGDDPNILMRRLQDQSMDLKHLDSTVTAYRMFLTTLSDKTYRLAQLVDNGVPGQFGSMATAEAEMVRHAQLFGEVQAMYKGVQTNIARALNSMRLPVGVDENMVRNIAQLGDPAASDAARKLASRLILAGGDPGKLAALARGSMVGKLIDAHNEYWINAILSGPKTLMVNTMGNLATALANPAERAFAGAIHGDRAMMMDGVRVYSGMAQSLFDSLEMAAAALKNGRNILDPANEVIEGSRYAISSRNLGIENEMAAAVTDGLGTMVRLPSRLMLSTDEFFKQVAYRGNVYSTLMRQGIDQGKSGDALKAWVAKEFKRAFNPTGAATNREALQAAREVTFSQDLLPGTFGSSVSRVVNNHPLLRPILPFVRTPTNIMRYVWQRTPGINLLQAQYMQDMRAGGQRAALARAKMLTGGGLWSAAYMLTVEGRLTGGGPADSDLRKRKLETGWQPYSVVTVDEKGIAHYTSFKRLDPFSTFLGIAADFAEVAGQVGERDLEETAMAATVALADNLNPKSYLQGLVNALNAFAQPDRKVERWWFNQAGSYVPSVVNTFKGDAYMREVRSTLDAIKARLPGHSENLDPQRNLLGEKIEVPTSLGPNWLSPFAFSSWKADGVADEIARVTQINRSAFRPPNRTWGDFDLTDYKVNGKQSAYDRLQELSGTLKIQGMTLKERLEDLVQSPAYLKATDGNADYDGSRITLIRGLIGAYRKAAEGEMVREHESLWDHYVQHQRNRLEALRE
ncbi:hypothetical protein [Azospirillum doebereinerae]|uniref:Large polyvalent protein associated domain-containing protein n=1 Tax=Azospirillum doebereinerae TaxID=92933 RepID=A0A3S0WPS9_9PROT|nr:hypothetical protein [Azospirillum doebereinerae]RUQ75776.1 hypothetical protein EJ913_01295 [Azospirillum doebereinerae]